MKIKANSISVKLTLLYILLSIINISLFSIIIYENQIDLIIENTKYHAENSANNLIHALDQFSEEINIANLKQKKKKDQAINEIYKIISKIIPNFIIFSENGKIIYRSNNEFNISKSDIYNGIKSVTNLTFTGNKFYSTIDEDTYTLSFYIPFNKHIYKDSILLLKINMHNIGKRLSNLYKLIVIIIIMITIFHIIFAIILYRIFVKPIESLHKNSIEITQGNFSSRAETKYNDEIGELATAFNSMADSIQEKITTLQNQNEQVDIELNIAAKVQEIIFPEIESNNKFNYSIFHRASGKVSGDYYDIFPLDNGNFGFLIVDVSGHGMPAALVTMIVKEKFKLYTKDYTDPAELFKKINLEITDILSGKQVKTGTYFSAFYMVIDNNNIVSFCNAGHTRPIIVRTSSKKIGLLDTNGFIVGISSEMNKMFETKQTKVNPGDKIILYTDGIVEPLNTNNEEFGVERIIESIKKTYSKSGNDMINTITDELEQFTNTKKLKDDATLFIIEMK